MNDMAAAVDRELLRANLERARNELIEAVRVIPASEWQRPSSDTAWTIGELFEHIVQSLEIAPREVASVRVGRGFINVPQWLFDWGNMLVIKINARRAS